MGFFATETKKNNGKSSFFTSSNEYDIGSVKKSLDNARLRIQDSGHSVEDADGRNWFEKATNLPQHQNALFDTLEILGRGGQAILNPISKAVKGEDQNVASSFFKGLSGKEKVRGSDIVEDLGIENKFGKAILGTALEIGFDPLTYVPGGVLLKGAKLGAKTAIKPLKGVYGFAEKVSPKLKKFREEVAQPTIAAAKDKFGYAFNDDYKATETLTGGKSDNLVDTFNSTEAKRKYLQEEYANKLIKTAQTTGVEAGNLVGRQMESGLKQFEDVKGFEFPDGLQRTTDKSELIGAMNNNRHTVQTLGKEVNATRKEFETTISNTAKELDKIDRQLSRTFFTQENKSLRQLNAKKNVPANAATLATEKAFANLAPSPAYNYLITRRDELKASLDSLRAESKVVNVNKIAQIQKLVKDTEDLKEAIKNPLMIQKELARPVRELSEDKNIIAAAESLMKNDAEIRELATSEGISIGEMAGYMSHILSQEEKKLRKINNPVMIDQGNNGLGQPNKGLLNNREIMGSAEDINERLNKKKFEDNAYFATAQGQRRMIDYIQSVSFRKNVLNDRDFARPYVKGQDVPNNAVVIDTNNYKFIKESGDLMEEVASKDIGGQYVVTKATKQKLDKYKSSMTDEGSKAFLNAYDGIQSLWKRGALFSIGYHLRNDIGAKFNNWVGGMGAKDMVKYSKMADVDVFNAMVKGKETPLYNEYRQQGLAASSQNQIEFARRGADAGKIIEDSVRKGSQLNGKVGNRLKVELKSLKNPLNIFKTSQDLGTFVDQTNRFSAYAWAREKLKLSPKDAAKKVNEMQFDYSKTTNFERDFATRVMPFYRWMRNNLPYQIRQFANDPRKYAGVNKLRLNAQDAAGINDENVPDFMKESLAIPVTSDGKGSGKMLGFNIPMGDLTKLSKPGKTLVDSVSPLLKIVPEYTLNRNFFYNKPIEKFEGQDKKFNILGQELNVAIKNAYVLEQATGQIGRGVSNFFSAPEEADQDSKYKMPTFGVKGILKDFDANKATYFQLQTKLKALNDYISYIEQQTGEKPRTINEIKKTKSSFFAS